eukprot:jgi/Mesvir1/17442/Mv08719-RA.1
MATEATAGSKSFVRGRAAKSPFHQKRVNEMLATARQRAGDLMVTAAAVGERMTGVAFKDQLAHLQTRFASVTKSARKWASQLGPKVAPAIEWLRTPLSQSSRASIAARAGLLLLVLLLLWSGLSGRRSVGGIGQSGDATSSTASAGTGARWSAAKQGPAADDSLMLPGDVGTLDGDMWVLDGGSVRQGGDGRGGRNAGGEAAEERRAKLAELKAEIFRRQQERQDEVQRLQQQEAQLEQQEVAAAEQIASGAAGAGGAPEGGSMSEADVLAARRQKLERVRQHMESQWRTQQAAEAAARAEQGPVSQAEQEVLDGLAARRAAEHAKRVARLEALIANPPRGYNGSLGLPHSVIMDSWLKAKMDREEKEAQEADAEAAAMVEAIQAKRRVAAAAAAENPSPALQRLRRIIGGKDQPAGAEFGPQGARRVLPGQQARQAGAKARSPPPKTKVAVVGNPSAARSTPAPGAAARPATGAAAAKGPAPAGKTPPRAAVAGAGRAPQVRGPGLATSKLTPGASANFVGSLPKLSTDRRNLFVTSPQKVCPFEPSKKPVPATLGRHKMAVVDPKLAALVNPTRPCKRDPSKMCPLKCVFLSRECARGAEYADFFLNKAKLKPEMLARKSLALPPFAPGSLGTCAIVGNSANLMKSRRGPEIDAHDTVFRYNAPVGDRLAAHLGKKSSVIFLKINYLEAMGSGQAEYAYGLLSAMEKNVYNQTVWTINGRHAFLRGRDAWRLAQQRAALYDFVQPGRKKKPSGGFVLITNIKASGLCTRVDLYGFSGDQGYKYFQRRRVSKHHNMEFEHAVLRRLQAMGQVCVYGD